MSQINLLIEESKNSLFAKYEAASTAAKDKDKITREFIVSKIIDSGYMHYYLLEDNIDKLVKSVNAGESCKIEVGEKRDAAFSIKISGNKVEAYLTIVPAYGGASVTKEEVMALIETKGIKEGIIMDNIDKAVLEQFANDVLIAKGVAPIHGENAKLEVLIKENIVGKPKVKEDGHIDYKNIRELLIVQPGTELMRKIPKTLGTPGMDVFGKEIASEPGKDNVELKPLDGTKISETDANVIIAVIKGNPVVIKNQVKIDSTFVIDAVNLSTGNINFDGSVHIKGDVETGMEVKATGNIIINGSVRRARIVATGDIYINQGIIGSEGQVSSFAIEEKEAYIICGGNLQAKFIENALIEVEKNINVVDYIRQSNIISQQSVNVGINGGKGSIISGYILAAHNVTCNSAGTSGSAATKIEVGNTPAMKQLYESLVEKLKAEEKKLVDLGNVLSNVGKHEVEGTLSPRMRKMLVTVIKALQGIIPNISKYTEEKGMIEGKIASVADAFIAIKEELYYGVKIVILDKVFNADRDVTGPITLKIQAGRIVLHVDS